MLEEGMALERPALEESMQGAIDESSRGDRDSGGGGGGSEEEGGEEEGRKFEPELEELDPEPLSKPAEQFRLVDMGGAKSCV